MANTSTTEALSLFLIQSLQRAIENARSTMVFLDPNLPPSEVLSLSDRFLRVLNTMDGSVTLAKSTIAQLRDGYKTDITRYESMRNAMICRVNDRKITGAALNTNAELYDGENLLYGICIMNPFAIQEITQPSQYSVLSIYKKLSSEAEYQLITGLKEKTFELLLEVDEYLQVFKNAILSYRRLIGSPQFMTKMSTDISTPECVGYIKTMQNSMTDLITKMEGLRKRIMDIFQVYLAMEKNYSIYEKAIDALTSIALESILDPYANYEFI